jgi:hypothetical protein
LLNNEKVQSLGSIPCLNEIEVLYGIISNLIQNQHSQICQSTSTLSSQVKSLGCSHVALPLAIKIIKKNKPKVIFSKTNIQRGGVSRQEPCQRAKNPAKGQ